jgi:exopolysaccharide production protein ExoZ
MCRPVRPDTKRAEARIIGPPPLTFSLQAARLRRIALSEARLRASILAGSKVVMTLTVLQGGRAIAALAVLQLHAVQAADKREGARGPGWLTSILEHGHLGVDFFFVLSGFIILHVHANDRRGLAAASSYAWRRITRIYVPYLPLVLAIIALYIAVPSLGAEKNWSLFTSLTLIAAERPPAPALSAAWSLIHELMFYAIFLLSYWAPGFRWLIAAWVVLIGVTNYLPIDIAGLNLPPVLQASLKVFLSPLNIEFVAGMIAAVTVRSLSLVWARVVLVAGITGLAGFFAIEGISRVWFGVAMAIVIVGLVRMEMAGAISAPRWLFFLGNASYAIYLIHGPVISIASGVLVSFALSWLATMTLSAAIGLGCGILYHLLFEKPALLYINRWRASPIRQRALTKR